MLKPGFPAALDHGAANPHPYPVSRSDGRSGKDRTVAGEESPGSMDIRCRITSGGREPRESATENEPPVIAVQVEMASKGEKVR